MIMIRTSIVSDIVADLRQDSMMALESELCRRTGAAHCVLTSGGMQGIILALRCAGVKPGDTVICPALGDPSLLHAVLYAGATPIFSDVNPDTWLLDSFCLEYTLHKCVRTGQPTPTAVISGNLFGLPCNYPAIESVCEQYEIALIEDMRRSLGAGIGERKSGCFGDYSVTLLPGDDGVACIFCRELESLKRLSAHSKAFAEPDLIAIEAAHQSIYRLEHDRKERSRVAAEYQNLLGGAVKTQQVKSGYYSAYNDFVIAFADEESAAAAGQRLMEKNLGCDTPLPQKLHKLSEISGGRKVVLPHAQTIGDKLIALPIHPDMNSKTIAQVAQIVSG